MFAKGRSNLQASIDYDFEVLRYMLGSIPSLIEQSSKAIQEQINKDAEATACGDYDIQIDISSNDYRNELLSLNNDVNQFFTYIMTTMIFTFAESKLKQLANEAKKLTNNQSKVENLYNNIKKKIIDLQPLENVWSNFKDFKKSRNHITHELFDDRVRFSHNVMNNPSTEQLEINLKQVHKMLREIADKIEEHEQRNSLC